MNTHDSSSRIVGVRSDYAPRYPARLSPAEYRALLLPDQQRRLWAAARAAAASVALGAALPAQQPDARAPGAAPAQHADRADRIAALLSRVPSENSMWLEHASFAQAKDAHGHPVVLPQIPISFGNSHNGVFDAERARQLAFELFEIYGLKPARDQRPDGVAATIDVLDRALQIGAELRGQVPAQQEMFGEPAIEAPEQALDDAELAALTRQGYRIQTVDLANFPLMDGDQLTPTIAYLAGIVAFLNSVTGGPDVDLTAILERHRVQTGLPAPRHPAAVRIQHEAERYQLHVTAAARVTFEFADCEYERRLPPTERGGATTYEPVAGPLHIGDTALMQLHVYPAAAMIVEQDGKPPIRVAAKGPAAFLPGRFDPQRPFRVTLELTPQDYTIVGALALVGAR